MPDYKLRYEHSPSEAGSLVAEAIKKVIVEDSNQITLSDIILIKKIEEELKLQNLIRPALCRCNNL